MYQELSEELLRFLDESPSTFHMIAGIAARLERAGFQKLEETEEWELELGGRYYVIRNDSSLIAFHMGKHLEDYRFQIAASHSDFPTFKIKEKSTLSVREQYIQLNTEGYGGMICSSWLDRPLSVAGRVLVKSGECFDTKLINIDRDLVMIPSVAIHMNRKVNEGMSYNKQIDMLPLFGGRDTLRTDLDRLIAEELGVEADSIYGKDLYLYNRMKGTVWGMRKEFLSAQHLDDGQCAYGTLQGFLRGEPQEAVNVYACFDSEEVGSGTKQGAGSTFLYDVLRRINHAIGKTEEAYYRAVSGSFMVSADNAHAVHPNHPEKTDAENCVYMNQGIVIKSHAGQKYTSDAVSIALFREICEKANVPVQYFANRSDEAGGSTLGNISSGKVSLNTVDIGLPQLAMHAAYETAGVMDTRYLADAMAEFFRLCLQKDGTTYYWR